MNPTRRRVLLVLGGLVVLVLVVGVWQALSAGRSLLSAREHGQQVEQRVRMGDFEGATAALRRLRGDADNARDSTDGLLWDVGRHLPLVGRSVGAVQTVSDVLDVAVRDNAPVALQLSQAAAQGRFLPRNGRFDVADLERLRPPVERAGTSLQHASDRLEAIRARRLVFPFNDLVGDLQAQVEQARSSASAAATGFRLLPGMLGEGGKRRYLLMIQNPAELRSTGGLPGSVAVLTADHGRVTMGWQGSAHDINSRLTGPVAKLPEDTRRQYGDLPARDFRDTVFSPDFPEAAQLAALMAEKAVGGRLDGVVSVDPVALSGVLEGTGPVDVLGVPLTAQNVVPGLLNRAYQQLSDQLAQDEFFKTAARRIFDAVMAGTGDQRKSIRGLADAASQHRVLVWSAHADEERQLAGTAVAGELAPAERDRPELGLYLNNGVGGKMDYYLDVRSSLVSVSCRDGVQRLRATVSFTSKMPRDFHSLSVWILGDGSFAPQGTIGVNLRAYAPLGGEITDMEVDGHEHSVSADTHHGRQVARLPVVLKPGEQRVVVLDVTSGKGETGDAVLDTTPGVVPLPNGVRVPSTCD